ncbi:MAG: hypothetical protein FWE44_03875 [Defluviitaleaceae bacterium]|nr:hypothetical protein [Defluviitaleaceae bacterium]
MRIFVILVLLLLFLSACIGGSDNYYEDDSVDRGGSNQLWGGLPFPIPQDGGGAAQQERPDNNHVAGMGVDWVAPFTPPEAMELDIDRGAVIAVAINRSFAIGVDGTLYSWGNGFSGRLGDGATSDRHYPAAIMEGVSAVAASNYLAYAITNDRALYGWGGGQFNQGIGDGPDSLGRLIPTFVFDDVVSVTASGTSASFITTEGNMYAFGQAMWSLMRFSFVNPREWPNWQERVPVMYLHGIQRISFNENVGAMVINHAGELHGWDRHLESSGFVREYFVGWNFGARNITSVSAEILPTMQNIADVSVGEDHVMILTQDGRVYTWGRNNRGQLGNGTNADSPSELVFVMDNVIHISAGHSHNLAITANGTLYAWGNNQFGRLGTGNVVNANTPVAVLQNVNTAVAGVNHSMAVTNDGRLWAWGDNRQGQLGDGTTTSHHSPVVIMENMMTVQR